MYGASSEEGLLSFAVEDSVSVVGEELNKVVSLVGLFVEVVVCRPDRVVEVEISDEEGAR